MQVNHRERRWARCRLRCALRGQRQRGAPSGLPRRRGGEVPARDAGSCHAIDGHQGRGARRMGLALHGRLGERVAQLLEGADRLPLTEPPMPQQIMRVQLASTDAPPHLLGVERPTGFSPMAVYHSRAGARGGPVRRRGSRGAADSRGQMSIDGRAAARQRRCTNLPADPLVGDGETRSAALTAQTHYRYCTACERGLSPRRQWLDLVTITAAIFANAGASSVDSKSVANRSPSWWWGAATSISPSRPTGSPEPPRRCWGATTTPTREARRQPGARSGAAGTPVRFLARVGKDHYGVEILEHLAGRAGGGQRAPRRRGVPRAGLESPWTEPDAHHRGSPRRNNSLSEADVERSCATARAAASW